MLIVKGDGTREPFSAEKLERSLKHAHASEDIARNITRTIETGLRDGMSTTEIYRQAFSLLRKGERVSAGRVGHGADVTLAN